MASTYLRRYTDIPALNYLLRNRQITLLDPQSWDDSNDSHYFTLYREKKRLGTVLALCFTEAAETYHHWRVFAGGSSGVCIRFKRRKLLRAMGSQLGLRMRRVRYLTLKEIRDANVTVDQLPFLKRFAFEHEEEFRVIYESVKGKKPKLDVAIPLSSIDGITLSPWMHPDLYPDIKRMIRLIPGCDSLKIHRSTLIGNEEWKRLGEAAP